MGTFALYAALAATPAAAFWAFARMYEWLTRYDPVAPARMPAKRSIEGLVRDLSRLGRDQRRLRHSDPPARAARLESVMLAYDDLCWPPAWPWVCLSRASRRYTAMSSGDGARPDRAGTCGDDPFWNG